MMKIEKILRFSGLFISFTIFYSSCIKDDSPPVPAYIYVDQINFAVDTALQQGSASSALTDVWVSVDGQSLGANNPGSIFPVLFDSNLVNNNIKIYGGIKENGINNTRIIYPFYAPFEIDMKLQSGKIDTFSPVLNYDPDANIIIVEDFENNNQPIFTDDRDGNPNTYMLIQSDEVFEGNASGQLLLDSVNLECTIASSTRYYDLQPSGSSFPVYLEINYKTNTAFQVGLIAHLSNSNVEYIYKGGMNASSEWKKIYFNLTNEVFGAPTNEFSVVFKAVKLSEASQPEIYLDNIKLLHF